MLFYRLLTSKSTLGKILSGIPSDCQTVPIPMERQQLLSAAVVVGAFGYKT